MTSGRVLAEFMPVTMSYAHTHTPSSDTPYTPSVAAPCGRLRHEIVRGFIAIDTRVVQSKYSNCRKGREISCFFAVPNVKRTSHF